MLKKFLFFSVAAIMSTFVACNKDSLSSITGSATTSTVSTSELPSTITDFVDNNYPDADIASAAKQSETENYFVALNTGENLAFSRNGNHIGSDSPCDGVFADGHGHGGHGGPGGHGPGGHPHDSTHVHNDTLPAAITDYIAANYAGYTSRHGRNVTICTGETLTSVLVVPADSTLVPLMLFFDAQNAFFMSGTRVDYSTIPTAVSDAVTTNFADYTASLKVMKFTLASGANNYQIKLRKAGDRKRVLIAEDGTILCQ